MVLFMTIHGWVGLALNTSLSRSLSVAVVIPFEPFFVFPLRSQRREGVFCSVPPSGGAARRRRSEGAAIAFFRPESQGEREEGSIKPYSKPIFGVHRDLVVEPVHWREKKFLRGFGRPVVRKLGGEGDRFLRGRQDRGQVCRIEEGNNRGNCSVAKRPFAFPKSAYLENRARISNCYHGAERSGVGGKLG